MYDSHNARYTKFKRMISDITPFALNSRNVLRQWDFFYKNKENDTNKKIDIGKTWSTDFEYVTFRKNVRLPVIKSNEIIGLRAWFGGESLICVDGKPFGEINEYHRGLDLSTFGDGKEHTIEVRTVPHGLLGQRVKEPIFEEAELIIENKSIKNVIRGFYLANEFMKETKDSYLKDLLSKILDETLRKIEVPRDTESYFKGVNDNHEVKREVSWIWNAEDFKTSMENNLSESVIKSIIDAGKTLDKELALLKERFPSQGKIDIIGHAHIDYAWLWPISETKNKILRTFSNALRMTDKYENFKYIQSSAKMYDDLKEMSPEIFEKIQEKVRNGSWLITGGMWVESDCNIPSPESLIRQLFYGQNFFKNYFNRKCEIAWLPDVFGFSWLLPQILSDAGIKYFFTTKLTWNEKNKFPYDLCIWRGLDGSEVIYHSFENPDEGYNGKIIPEDIIDTWQNYRQKTVFPETLFTYGYGDGGGGPSDEMFENFLHMKNFPSIPELSNEDPVEFYKRAERVKDNLPVWDGELYLELHRGTLTTQSRTKMLHKKAEDALYLAELFSLFAEDNSIGKKLDGLWKTLLHNEFHDILPGSSIKEVYETSEKELTDVIEKTNDIKNISLSRFVQQDENVLTVFNPGSYSRPLLFEADLGGKKLTTANGITLKGQKTQNGWIYFGEKIIKPFSSIKLFISERKEPEKSDDCCSDGRVLENQFINVFVNDDGTINIYDKELDRELFNGSGNKLFLYDDVPPKWDAWDVDVDYEKSGHQLKAREIIKVEKGEIRQIIRVKYRINKTEIVQDYVLNNNSKRLDIRTNVDWHHRKTLLKATFPVNVLSRKAKYDIGTGYIERPTHRNTDFERARFESVAHRWMDLSEESFGVSLLNNGKYGHNCFENVMGISLLRSPVFPHFFADEGKHSFTYSIYSHNGKNVLNTLKQAEHLNKSLVVIEGNPSNVVRLIEVSEENFKVLTAKRNERGGIILRIAETLGARGKVCIRINHFHFSGVWLANILEEKKKELTVKNGKIEVEYEPFKIYTFLFE